MAAAARVRLTDDIRRLAADGGLSLGALARSSGVSKAFVARILDGSGRPSIETYARLTTVLGADLSARVYPNTGPLVRDRHQGPILEFALGAVHSRWHPYTEVPIRRPTRGWIDLVLHEARDRLLVATEIESELRRLEQTVRWSAEKAAGLPSWTGWDRLDNEPRISQLLLVRRTRATRQVASTFARQLVVAFPAHPDDAVSALTGTAPWAGAALVWVVVDAAGARFASGR